MSHRRQTIDERLVYDDRVMPGRSHSNADIWQASLEALQASREDLYGVESARTWPAQAALNLVNAAKKEAKRRQRAGETVIQDGGEPRPVTYKDILKEHARGVDALSRDSSRFVGTTQRGNRQEESPSALWASEARAARMRQDERRQTMQPTELSERAARRVEAETALVQPYLGDVYARFPNLQPPQSPAAGMLSRPPRTASSETPHADQLLLQQRMRDYEPPPQVHDGPPRELMDNPSAGGGMHNPLEADSDSG